MLIYRKLMEKEDKSIVRLKTIKLFVRTISFLKIKVAKLRLDLLIHLIISPYLTII
jgi:hypothetical protein